MGKRLNTGHLDVWIAASPSVHARVGIIVPKHKRSSVERNKLRRRLRELVRLRLLPVMPSYDVLIRSRPNAYKLPFEILAVEIGQIVKRVT